MYLSKFLEKQTNSNATQVTNQLLKSLKVPVTASTVIEELEQHPDYPSLYSISDNLSKWKVENLALNVDANKIDELPVPFIAHSKAGGGSFILVNDVNGKVEYIDEKGKRKQKSREEFSKEWDNIALLAEKSEASGEKDYRDSKRKELTDAFRIPLIIAGCLLLIVLYSVVWSNVFTSSLLVLKFAGSFVTGILLWFEIDKSNPVLQQICSGGKHTNCTAVLSSKQSKLFNFISWSEIGFFYFAGSFLFLLLTANWQLQTLSIISCLNLLALPYTVFSVFYQWRIAKQWCRLCLSVQAILILEFVVCYFGLREYSVIGSISKSEFIPLLASFFLPVFFWIATKKIYLSAQNGKRYKKELSKLKYNKEIFHALLSKQKQVTVSPEGLGITLGNPQAKNTIIKVCNPYCGPCAKAHPIIEEILENNEDVKVQIIFTATNDEADSRARPVRHLMAVAERNESKLTKRALCDWYNADKKDYDAFAAKYLLNGELQKQAIKLEVMDQWCKETGIFFTPTFFINGCQLPDMYRIEDLKHLL